MKTTKNFFNKLVRNKIILFAVFLLLILILTDSVFKSILFIYSINKSNNNDISVLIASMNHIINMVFFIIVASITILSYVQARKTLFTPIRTEIFKIQVKNFEDILLFFQNKWEVDFTEIFDFENILNANAIRMIDHYVYEFFRNEITIDNEKRSKIFENFSHGLMTKSYAEKHLVKPDYSSNHEKDNEDSKEITNPALKLNKWQKYEYGEILYTEKYNQEIGKLSHFIASPILPEKLKELIKDFQGNVESNLFLIGKVLTEISQEMPEKFPNAKSINDFDFAGLWNRYNEEKIALENDSIKILSYIKDYLKIEDLIE